MRKDPTDGKTKKDVETTETETTTAVDNDDIEEIPEEIPDDDSVHTAETSWEHLLMLFHDLLTQSYLDHCVCSVITANNLTSAKCISAMFTEPWQLSTLQRCLSDDAHFYLHNLLQTVL